jgi:hypothetical protein
VKIGLPKIRFSKKLAIISAGMLALLGGTGAAALYVGKDEILGPPKPNTTGGECQTIQTMVLKTPGKRLWMRKYVKMASADADMRIKTALRVAGLLAKTNKVDLIQVSILDDRGPDKRAFMRGRAIGAEVVIALQPRYVPEMKQPFIARYYDGLPAEDGRFYGERVDLDAEEVKIFMAAMKDEPDKKDCADIAKPEPAEGEKPAHGAAKPEHGATVSEGHEAPAAEGHGEAPAEGHGEKTAEGHGETPAGEEAKAEGHDEAPAAEPSMMDSVLGMVGLGGGEDKPAEGHDASAPSEGHAAPAAEEHGEAAKTEGHGEEAPVEGHGETSAEGHGEAPTDEEAKAESHGDTPAAEPSMMDSMMGMVGLGGGEEKPAEGHDAGDKTEGHAAPAKDGHETASAAPEPSMMDSMLGMVGLGGDEKADEDHGAAKTEGEHAPAEAVESDHAEPGADHGAASEHDASVDQGEAGHAAPSGEVKPGDQTASEEHDAAPAENHAAPAEDHSAAEDHAAPAEEHEAASKAGHDAEGAAKPEEHGQAETAHAPAPAEDHAAAPAEEGHGETNH